MTKIEEILEKYKTKTDYYADQDWYDEDVEKALIEYSEWYARKVLKSAAEKARTKREHEWTVFEHEIIDKESITNIQLPPHE